MRLMRGSAVTVWVWVLSIPLASNAGVQAASNGAENKEVLATGGLISSLMAAAITGEPYSAMQVTQTNRKLTDGTTLARHGHHFVARDSEGRVRVERRLAKGNNGESDTVMVFVMDPIAHTTAIWTTGSKAMNKTVMVIKVPATKRQEPAKPLPTSTGPQPVVTVEDLGTQSIQGLPVTVEKKTTIVPVGRSGNDAPITKDLKLVMKRQWEDPRSGETTVSLEDFSRAEPDAALFRVPAGYAVKTLQQSLKELEEKLGETSQN